MLMPQSLGLMAAIFVNQIEHTKNKIRLQTGFSNDIVEILTTPDSQLDNIERDKLENAF